MRMQIQAQADIDTITGNGTGTPYTHNHSHTQTQTTLSTARCGKRHQASAREGSCRLANASRADIALRRSMCVCVCVCVCVSVCVYLRQTRAGFRVQGFRTACVRTHTRARTTHAVSMHERACAHTYTHLEARRGRRERHSRFRV
jgi:hypothetical protein